MAKDMNDFLELRLVKYDDKGHQSVSWMIIEFDTYKLSTSREHLLMRQIEGLEKRVDEDLEKRRKLNDNIRG